MSKGKVLDKGMPEFEALGNAIVQILVISDSESQFQSVDEVFTEHAKCCALANINYESMTKVWAGVVRPVLRDRGLLPKLIRRKLTDGAEIVEERKVH